ncbi:hypothetical protein JVU11DRAFT_2242 [Chiua virens]|nr:hypothetical protein JVU11DRAFT_2242 [Chiua virens]
MFNINDQNIAVSATRHQVHEQRLLQLQFDNTCVAVTMFAATWMLSVQTRRIVGRGGIDKNSNCIWATVHIPCYQIHSLLVSRQVHRDPSSIPLCDPLLAFLGLPCLLTLSVLGLFPGEPLRILVPFFRLAFVRYLVALTLLARTLGGINCVFNTSPPFGPCYFRHARPFPSMRYIVHFHHIHSGLPFDRRLAISSSSLPNALFSSISHCSPPPLASRSRSASLPLSSPSAGHTTTILQIRHPWDVVQHLVSCMC